MIHSEKLYHKMSAKFSIFQVWSHKLPSGEYSKSFVSKQLYSKLKVAQKNVQKWTKTLFFKHEPAHKTGKMTSLETTSYLCGKLFSDCGLMIFRFLVKFWWRKIHCWKINKILSGLQVQQDYNIQLHCPQDYIGWADLCNIYNKDKELKENLRKAPELFSRVIISRMFRSFLHFFVILP